MRIESSQVSMNSQSSFNLKHTSISRTVNYDQDSTNGNNKEAFLLDFSQQINVESSFSDKMTHEEIVMKLLLQLLWGETFEIPRNEVSLPESSIEFVRQDTIEEYHQKQTVDFNTSVNINTNKGSFNFDLSLSYSKELYERYSSSIILAKIKTKDPLIINYNENVNPFENLSKLKFKFDLDQDHKDDLIPKLKYGAGYLALDKNNNGKIDNGSELFGTKSNNGFRDLKEYDLDNNNWIDENDEVFNKLRVWQIDDAGNDKLVSLIDLNIGAIYLGDVASGYRYQDDIQNVDALQKSNGIFVKEDGSGIGMVNSIDIVV